MSEEKVLTGKPSIDRPWMKYYPPIMLQMIHRPECGIQQYLKNCLAAQKLNDESLAIRYYGREVKWGEVFAETELLAKAFTAIGFGEGDQIPVYLRLVPEFIPILLAAEKIGASVLCRDNTLEENVEAAAKAGAKTIIAHTFLSEDDKAAYKAAGVEKFILLSPLRKTPEESLAPHQKACLDSYSHGEPAEGEDCVDYDSLLAVGAAYEGAYGVPEDNHRILFRAYTSGSTGPSKQVIHTADSMLSIICQMNFYGAADSFRPTWMVTCLPPALVATVVSMVLLPLASNKILIMDPFVFEEDVDLDMMLYRPNNWPLLPMFIETIMRNGRVPEDYDMSHLLAAGAGSESYNNNQLMRAQNFVAAHNCKFRFTTGYGQSEAGSNVSMPMAPKPIKDGNIGVPLPLSVMSIFKPGTQEELTYNQIGEICKTGPGNMIGYDNEEATKKALQLHDDGNVWLHMGDLGYMDEDGVIYTVTRGESPRFGGGNLCIQPMENLIGDAQIPGIDDEFFVLVPDQEHEGCFLPYLFTVLFDGYEVSDIAEQVNAVLEPYMYPVKIFKIEKRPFYHYKTDRLGLKRKILSGELQ